MSKPYSNDPKVPVKKQARTVQYSRLLKRWIGAPPTILKSADVNAPLSEELIEIVGPYSSYEPAAPTRSQRSSGTQSVKWPLPRMSRREERTSSVSPSQDCPPEMKWR